MSTSKIALTVAGALLAATAMTTVAEARGEGGGGGGNHRTAYCLWHKQKAMSTGEEYWWARWRQCMRGWD